MGGLNLSEVLDGSWGGVGGNIGRVGKVEREGPGISI